MMNFAIIGFGGMGKVHYGTAPELLRRLGDTKLVAICDIDEDAFHSQTEINLATGKVDLNLDAYHLYTDADELFEKEELDFVIIALPTYLHETMAVKAMERGIHVFSEKPMALNVEQAEHMLETAKKNHVKLMIGQCLRFASAYKYLKELIDTKKYGNVIRADFNRISALVKWSSQNWMLDETKSGGAALDMHVHDVDYIQWVFGMPKAVTTAADNHVCKHSTVFTVYHYEDDKLVTATGDWGMPQSYPFFEGYTVRFEKATVVMARNEVKVYEEDGEVKEIALPVSTHTADELEEFIACIRENRESSINPPEASLASVRIAMAEKLSADTGKTVEIK